MSGYLKYFIIIISLLCFIPTNVSAQISGSYTLFEINEQFSPGDDSTLSQALTTQYRRDVLQSLPLTVNNDVLDQVRSSKINSFQMTDINGELMTVEIKRIIEHLNDDWSVTGFINGNPINSFTLSYSNGLMLSSIRNITSHTFMEISYRAEYDSHYLHEIDPHKTDKISCGFDHSDVLMRQRSSKRVSNLTLPQSTGTAIIDVMIVYTPAAEAWALSEEAGGVGIQNVINQSMTLAQNAVDNSNIDLEFRLVHAAKVNYTETVTEDESGEMVNDSGVDLENLTNGEIPNVHELREQYKADLVAMFTDVEDTGGIAWMATGDIDDAEYAFSITRVQQAANTSTHAHEMGHNMGNDHTRNQKESPSIDGGIFEYSTGWRWIGNNGETFISVMSYDEPADDDENGKDEDGNPIYGIQVDYFSNPDISFQGVPTGSYSGKYAPADASRSMREMMSTVSNYRVSVQDDDNNDDNGGGDDDNDDEPVDTSAIPENLTLQYSEGTITLNWDAVNSGQLTGYNVYRSNNSNDIQFHQFIDVSNTSFQDNPDETMFYAVSAVYGSNDESSLSNIISFYTSEESVGDDWQLISNPLKNSIGVQLQIVGFNQVYTRENTLIPGKGYWVRRDTQGILNLAGEGFISGDIELNSGWNLVGGLADTFLLSDISDPQNILSSAQVYQYSGGVYNEITGSLTPGRGYWMHADESGTIRFQIAGTATSKIQNTRKTSEPISGFHRLEFISDGIVQNFWISDQELHSDERMKFLLPPIAPSGFLDVRSDENFSITDQAIQNIHLTSDHYPVVINFYQEGQLSDDYTYRLVGIKDQDEIHFNLTGQQLEIPFQMDLLRLERVSSNDLISEFKLHSNYPNPFNPTTNIRYELPQQSPVRIEVFDVVGRRIALLVDTIQQTGTYTVQFDGTGIASGLYLLRFQAGRFNESRQITLIK